MLSFLLLIIRYTIQIFRMGVQIYRTRKKLEMRDAVRNIEIGRSFPRSSREDRKQNRAAYQAKVDLFKRKLEVASKYSIVGKEIVPRKSGDSDGNFRYV